MDLVSRKPLFRVCDLVMLKPFCSATETSYNIEIWHNKLAASTIILSRKRITKTRSDFTGAQADLCLCCLQAIKSSILVTRTIYDLSLFCCRVILQELENARSLV